MADWGPVSRKVMNPFVTLDALYILRAAGRWSVDKTVITKILGAGLDYPVGTEGAAAEEYR
jgi:hypothetical protein